jgi:hypothetical protein
MPALCYHHQHHYPNKHYQLNDNNNYYYHYHHREAPEVYRLERRAYKNMTTLNALYNITSTIDSCYYHKQITRKFQTAQYPPCCIYSNVESSNT